MKFNSNTLNISLVLLILISFSSINSFIEPAFYREKVVLQDIKISQTVQSPNGIPISNAAIDEYIWFASTDGAGGAFITYERPSYYGQHVDPNGNFLWNVSGLNLNINGKWPRMQSDGYGGFFLVYDLYNQYGYDFDPDLYTMRFDSNGAKLWPGDNVNISTIEEDMEPSIDPHTPDLCSDGGGGVFVTWRDSRLGAKGIYIQRINATGTERWTLNGIRIMLGFYPKICPDGVNGAIVASQYGTDIYAQRINSTGDIQWIINGKNICTFSSDQFYPEICSDGVGGAIIAWEDNRYGAPHQSIYAQRINLNGDLQWDPNGIEIAQSSYYIEQLKIISDGSNGAIITWQDQRSGEWDIYAQKVNSSGNILWGVNGTAICTADSYQQFQQMCNDGSGGAIISWEDNRAIYDDNNLNIYAQRINSTGDIQWLTNGIPICKAFETQEKLSICPDNQGGAIITWDDYRDQNHDVYAQRVAGDGTILWLSENGIPTSNHPGDISLSKGSSGSIAWILLDDHGTGKYQLKVDNIPIDGFWYDWYNNSQILVPIDTSDAGIYNYTIEYYDIEYTFGVHDSVQVTITSNGNGTSIPYGHYYLLFGFLGIVSIIIAKRRKILSQSKI